MILKRYSRMNRRRRRRSGGKRRESGGAVGGGSSSPCFSDICSFGLSQRSPAAVFRSRDGENELGVCGGGGDIKVGGLDWWGFTTPFGYCLLALPVFGVLLFNFTA